MCHISCTWGQGRMFRKHWLYFYSLPVKGIHKQNQWLPVTIRHFPPWESNGQVKLDWSERETIGRQLGKDGTTDNRQLEGKGRKMKDPRSWWGDLCSHGLICPLIPYCVDRWVQATLHCGFARRGLRPTVDQPCQASAVGLGGASKSAWCTTLQTENNVYCSWPLAKWHCLDMTHRSYGTFKICQTNGSKIEHMSTRISQQLQMLLNLHNSPGMILASQGHTFKTQTLHSLILIYSIWMIIRFSANERITTWVGS